MMLRGGVQSGGRRQDESFPCGSTELSRPCEKQELDLHAGRPTVPVGNTILVKRPANNSNIFAF